MRPPTAFPRLTLRDAIGPLTALALSAGLSLACAGESRRPSAPPPVPRTPSSTSPSRPAPPVAATTPVRTGPPPRAAAFAPSPAVRVGLSTTARIVRLSSAKPLRVTVGGRAVESYELLIEPGRTDPVEGRVHRLQLASFPRREEAQSFLRRLREDEGLEDELAVWRESGSGRYSVRLGSFPSEPGAHARLRELEALGFEGGELVVEPTRTPRPAELLVRAPGQPVLSTTELSVSATPGSAGAWVEVDGRPYRGFVEIFVNRTNRFTVVNVVNLEDYLKGVVPAELSPRAFPEKEALKAQALAARTYVLKRRGQYEAEGYDICATPACQVYRGVSVEDPMSSLAVDETESQVLSYQGELVDALYTSTCGGRTENAENVFSNPFPYLVSRACFLEANGEMVRAGGASASLEAALVAPYFEARGADPYVSSRAGARAALEAILAELGQPGCFDPSTAEPTSALDTVSLADILGRGLCWQRRLPFLLSAEDASRWVSGTSLSEPESLHLAFAIREGLVVPPGDGIVPGRALPAAELHRSLYRVIERQGPSPLEEAVVESVSGGRLNLVADPSDEESERTSTTLSPESRLFRRHREGTFFAPELMLLPGDRVWYRPGDRGLDVLVVESNGASFDRSSRMSHWTVRTTNEDLSREMNQRYDVGTVVELRPLRYGRSGRVIELRVEGTAGSVDLTGLAIRRALGIRENLFFLDRQGLAGAPPDSWVFTGRGWGHGVGLCQVGAYGMAAAGFGYRQILAHYYAGVDIERRAFGDR